MIAALQDQLDSRTTRPGPAGRATACCPRPGGRRRPVVLREVPCLGPGLPTVTVDPGQLETFRPLGISDDTSPYIDPPAELHDALVAGAAAGHQQLVDILRAGTAPKHNGWTSALHTFDYNTDYFELGTIDSPDWKITDPRRATITRAIAVLGGLWGNHGYEAATSSPTKTSTATPSTAPTATPSPSTPRHRARRSGPSPCTTCPTTTWSPTPSVATPSATAPPASTTTDNGSLTLTLQHDEPTDPVGPQQLAPHTGRRVPTNPACLRPRPNHPRRHLRNPRHHPHRIIGAARSSRERLIRAASGSAPSPSAPLNAASDRAPGS